MFWPGSYPRGGNSLPVGSENLNDLPSAPMRESVRGLKERDPAKAIAVTTSGDATKAWVAGLASLRPVKLRLYDVMTRREQAARSGFILPDRT